MNENKIKINETVIKKNHIDSCKEWETKVQFLLINNDDFFEKNAEKSLKFLISKFQTFPPINLNNNYLPIDLLKELNCGQL